MKREQLGNELPEPVRRYFLEVARMDPPSDLMDRAVAEIEATRRTNAFTAWLPAFAAVAVAAVVIAVVALNLVQFDPTPIGTDTESPSASASPAATTDASPTPAPIVSPPPFDTLPSAGAVVERIDVGNAGGPLVSAFGSLWLGREEEGFISRFDPRSGTVVATILINEQPTSPSDPLAIADESFVYASGRDESIVKIDPATNEIVDRWEIGTVPYRMSVTGTYIWVSDLDGGTVTRLDTATGEVMSNPYSFRPGGILATPDAVWMMPWGDARMHRIDPSTGESVERYSVWGFGMQILTDGGDSLYLSGNNGRPVERFSISEGRVTARTPEIGVTLADGNLWATHWDERTVVLLDPLTLEWQAGIAIGGTDGVGGFAFADGYGWVHQGTELIKLRLDV